MPILSTALLAPVVMMAEPSALPLRKLRLYETGVGYFERRGNVGPKEDLALPLPASHLDDALKSLVILEATGGVQIRGIDFDSSVSEDMARAMAGLPTDDTEPLAYDDLLASLKGSRIQIRTKGSKVRGRFVDLEGPFYTQPERKSGASNDERTDQAQPQGEPHYTLILLDDDNALRRIKTDRVDAIEVLDERTAARLDVAATALSDQAARQTTPLEIQVSSAGRLGLGYVSEAAVWRTTYRVVMEPKVENGQLQAWALSHTDTDADWKKVSVELANGRPTSFLHPLAAPRYLERELVDAPEGLTTVPQLANRTVDGLVGTEIGEAYGVGGLGLVGTGRGGGGSGYGTIGAVDLADSGGVTLGDLAELSQADGTESGALFLYRVADPIDLPAHRSALLPIVQNNIEVEAITLFAPHQSEGLSAARLVNSTKQTLPPGTVSFFADGGFVGEAVFDRLKPHERRFVPYGYELDVELTRSRQELGERVTALRWREDHIVESYVLESEIELTMDNRSGRDRRVYVGLEVPRRADLTGDGQVELDYDLANDIPLAATRVPAGKTVVHTLRAKELTSRSHEDVGLAALKKLSKRKGLPAAQRDLLQTSIDQHQRALSFDEQVRKAKQSIVHNERDLGRIRKNLAALGDAGSRGSSRNQLARDMLRKESAIKSLRAQIAKAQAGAKEARRLARANLEGLNAWKPASSSSQAK